MTHSTRHGFTLIEVTLFLAITGMLLIGILGSTWTSISRQRANDTVQNFADFLRGQYSAVANVQNNSSGQSERAIYGHVINFGESNDFSTTPPTSDGTVYVYDLVGDLRSSDSIIRLTVSSMLGSVNADIDFTEGDAHGEETYRIRNGALLRGIIYQNSSGDNIVASRGSVIITRSPNSGSIYTFMLVGNNDSDIPMVQSALQTDEPVITAHPLRDALENDGDLTTYDHEGLRSLTLDFCIQPQDLFRDRIYDIRLNANTSNSTGIEIINLDADDNICERELL